MWREHSGDCAWSASCSQACIRHRRQESRRNRSTHVDSGGHSRGSITATGEGRGRLRPSHGTPLLLKYVCRVPADFTITNVALDDDDAAHYGCLLQMLNSLYYTSTTRCLQCVRSHLTPPLLIRSSWRCTTSRGIIGRKQMGLGEIFAS